MKSNLSKQIQQIKNFAEVHELNEEINIDFAEVRRMSAFAEVHGLSEDMLPKENHKNLDQFTVIEISKTYDDETGEEIAYFSCSMLFRNEVVEYVICNGKSFTYYIDIDSALSDFFELIKEQAYIEALSRNWLPSIEIFKTGEKEDSHLRAIKITINRYNNTEYVMRLLETGKVDASQLLVWIESEKEPENDCTETLNEFQMIVENWILNQKLKNELCQPIGKTKRSKI